MTSTTVQSKQKSFSTSEKKLRSGSTDVTAESELTSPEPNEVRDWLARNSYNKQIALLDKFLIELRRGRLLVKGPTTTKSTSTNDGTTKTASLNQSSSLLIAHRTVNLLRHMIGSTNWKSGAELLCMLRGLGQELQCNVRGLVAVGNIVRRVMADIREEIEASQHEETNVKKTTAVGGGGGRLSLDSMLWTLPQHVRTSSSRGGHGVSLGSTTKKLLHHVDKATYDRQDSTVLNATATSFNSAEESNDQQCTDFFEAFPPHYYTHRPDLKQAVMEGIEEILSDLENLHKNINEQATNHIQSGDIILTVGQSKTIELFLKSAATKIKRSFQVIIVACGGNKASNFGTYEMAKSLADSNIETTVISESAVFAIMARIHKILLPARAVLANGGLVTSVAGSNLVVLAAKHHSVPIQCVTGLIKLCPQFPHEGQDTLNELLGPEQMHIPSSYEIELINPAYDYIEPRYIGLYITNVGTFQPSFIYRMLAENYHIDDWDSFA